MLAIRASITLAALVDLARGPKSEDGENPEYDRALAELVTDAAGLPMDERGAMAALLGIKPAGAGNT